MCIPRLLSISLYIYFFLLLLVPYCAYFILRVYCAFLIIIILLSVFYCAFLIIIIFIIITIIIIIIIVRILFVRVLFFPLLVRVFYSFIVYVFKPQSNPSPHANPSQLDSFAVLNNHIPTETEGIRGSP
jgi:hypothetical protein